MSAWKAWTAAVLLLAGVFYCRSDYGPGPVRAADRRRYERDSGGAIADHVQRSLADMRRQMQFEQNPAIQVGKLSGHVVQEERDGRWYGTVRIWVGANYSATYGLPFKLLEKGFRIEKDVRTSNLVVVVSGPQLLCVAVDTGSMHLEGRAKSGLRRWKKQAELESRAYRKMSRLADENAARLCQEPEAREQTRAVVCDLVLDVVGEVYSRRMKRSMARRVVVVFEHELDPATGQWRMPSPAERPKA